MAESHPESADPRPGSTAKPNSNRGRERAMARSLRDARARAETQSDRFIRSAMAILAETGRTDFTVQEVVERARTSLRTFYQYFESKEELLLTVFDEIVSDSAELWCDEVARLDSADALRLLIERAGAQPRSSAQASINRAVSLYYDRLAEDHPHEYARSVTPLWQLVRDVLDRGTTEGAFDIDADLGATAAILTHVVLSALRIRVLGEELGGTPVDAAALSEFCLRSLSRAPDRAP